MECEDVSGMVRKCSIWAILAPLALILSGCSGLDLFVRQAATDRQGDDLSDLQKLEVQQMIEERLREEGRSPRWDK